MQREFNGMPFQPEFTAGGPTQAFVQSGAPSAKLKIEAAQKRFKQLRQNYQVQQVVGKYGENLGPGIRRGREAGKRATEKLKDQAERENAENTLERLDKKLEKEKEPSKKKADKLAAKN